METSDREQRHRERMKRKKAVVDAAIEHSDRDQGLLLVLTGNGKGKSSSAFGMVARALGHGMRVAVLQYVKGEMSTGEEAFFRGQPGISFQALGDGFTWDTQDRAQDMATAARGWAEAARCLADPELDLVVLDELCIVLKLGYLPVEPVLEALARRPAQQHVVITGRGAPDALIEAADTVTEMRPLKHAFDAGIMAQKGIEL